MRIISKISERLDLDKNVQEEYTGHTKKSSVIEFYKLISNNKIFNIIYIVVTIFVGILIFHLLSTIASMKLSDILTTGEVAYREVTSLEVISKFYPVFIIYLVVAIIGYIKLSIQFKMSFGSLIDRTEQEYEGDARWSTREEINLAYKKIKDRDVPYPGNGGVPVARDGDDLYIDDSATNVLVIGTSRSGKGEEHVLPSIEIYSRAENKPSLIITDPKLELAPFSMKMLKERGYECHILNLIDPEYSMFYNPLQSIIDELKAGHQDQATEMRKSLVENIIPTDPSAKDKFFTDQAKNVLSAAIDADIKDNLEADRKLNKRLKYEYEERQKKIKKEAINKLSFEEQMRYYIKEASEKILENDPEIEIVGLRLELAHFDIPKKAREYVYNMTEDELQKYLELPKPKINAGESKFIPVKENEQKIHLNSIIRMVKSLYGTADVSYGTALDRYFMTRPEEDDARLLYGGVYGAGANAKGDIMATFSQHTDIFITENIGRMMSKNSLNLLDVGFGERPVAIFIALPDSNKANWFLATVFINQLYTTLAKYATAMPNGKTIRDVVFLLDEFGNLPAIDNIESIVSVSLGRRLRFHFIVQGFAQLENKYGKEGKTIIMDNCGFMKYILSTNEETKQTVSSLIGKHHVQKFNRSGRLLSISKEQTEMVEEVPLVTPEKLGKLLLGETIVLRPLNRKEKDGKKDQFANPIKNFGKYRMKFRYEYLSDLMPSDTLLYRSPAIEQIIKNNPDILQRNEFKDMKVLDLGINTTTGVNIVKVRRSAEEYVKNKKIDDLTISEYVGQSVENASKMDHIFDITNYSETKRKLVMSGKEPEYNFTVGRYIKYGYLLTKYPKWQSIGYEILNILQPIDYDKYLCEHDEDEFDWSSYDRKRTC